MQESFLRLKSYFIDVYNQLGHFRQNTVSLDTYYKKVSFWIELYQSPAHLQYKRVKTTHDGTKTNLPYALASFPCENWRTGLERVALAMSCFSTIVIWSLSPTCRLSRITKNQFKKYLQQLLQHLNKIPAGKKATADKKVWNWDPDFRR